MSAAVISNKQQGGQSNYDLFIRLFNNAKAFLEMKTGKKAPNVLPEHAIAYLSMNVKGHDLVKLEQLYRAQYQEMLDGINLTAEDENKLRRYLHAMLELL
jgi:hypothetical protein